VRGAAGIDLRDGERMTSDLKAKIIPYTEIDGCRTFLDRQIKGVYERIVEEGNYSKVFHGPGSPRGFEEFIAFMKSPANHVFIALEGERPILICGVNEVVMKRGIIHFCSFKNPFPRKKIRIGRGILNTLFHSMPSTRARTEAIFE
jgi:hypothetical protein